MAIEISNQYAFLSHGHCLRQRNSKAKTMKDPFKLIFLFFSISFSQTGNAQNNKSLPDTGAYFKSFDGAKIYYEVKGEGETILLVHGFIVNGQSWKRTELYKGSSYGWL
jgi:hypothetical protein